MQMNYLSSVTVEKPDLDNKPAWVDSMFALLKKYVGSKPLSFWLGTEQQLASALPSNPNSSSRLTVIDNDGVVFYDSALDYSTLDNHDTRKEVMGALLGYKPWAARESITTGQDTKYVAMYVSDNMGNGRTIRYAMSM